MNGIYVGYMTGSDGYSVIMFVLRDGQITGADVGGGTYHGSYHQLPDRLTGAVVATLPPNTASIAGHPGAPEGVSFSVPFEIRFEDIGQGFITLQSPLGTVNASIKKLQELP